LAKMYWHRVCNWLSQTFPEDISGEAVNETFRRIIAGERRTFDSKGDWERYLYSAARKNAITLLPPPPPPPPPKSDPPSAPLPEGLWKQLADRTWFGPPPVDAGIRRRLLTWIWMSKLTVESAIRFAQKSQSGKSVSNAVSLNRWLGDAWTLRASTFDVLYHSPDRLTACLIGEPVDLEELANKLFKASDPKPAFKNWKWQEVKVILLRFKFEREERNVCEAIGGELPEEEVTSVIVRCEQLFPFTCLMTTIWDNLEGHSSRSDIFYRHGVSKRLFAEYRFKHGLPVRDSYIRTHPAALVAGSGFSIENAGQWAANRLKQDMERCLKKVGAEFEL
jgi:hypothetical protein